MAHTSRKIKDKMTKLITVGRWLTDQFLKWQYSTKEIKTIAEFADYLADNSMSQPVSRPALSMWLNDKRKPTGLSVDVLAEKLGPEIYDLLGLSRPDSDLAFISSCWHRLSASCKRQIRTLADADLKA